MICMVVSEMKSSIEEDRECDAIHCVIEESGDLTPQWIGCDCGQWFHLFCLNLTEIDDNFLCYFCESETY